MQANLESHQAKAKAKMNRRDLEELPFYLLLIAPALILLLMMCS